MKKLFLLQKSGFVAKSMENFTIREFNQCHQGKNGTQRREL
jgi:phage pi2 protein 07